MDFRQCKFKLGVLSLQHAAEFMADFSGMLTEKYLWKLKEVT